MRLGWASGLLGLLAVACCGFVLLRLVETWRVTAHAASHRISIFGQGLSYPVANAAAVVLLALATLGLLVVTRGLLAAAREVAASRRFTRRLASEVSARAGDAFVIDDARPQAFCAGLARPRVYVTSGAIAILDPAALEAVLAHEQHHARRRDPLRFASARVLARAMFFLPALRGLGHRLETLAELSADEGAVVAAAGDRAAIARAMLSFSEAGPGEGRGIDPARVDYLLGEPPAWSFPVLLVAAAVTVLAVAVTIGLLAGRLAAGSATLAPPFLSAQPCIILLALIPASVIFIGVRFAAGRSRVSSAQTG